MQLFNTKTFIIVKPKDCETFAVFALHDRYQFKLVFSTSKPNFNASKKSLQ